MNEPTRLHSAGVAALDGPPRYGNHTQRHVDGVREPARYLRIRRAEFTCRGLATALRKNREELRGKSPSEAEALIGLPPGSIAILESADPCSPVGAWTKVWAWLDYLENVNRVAGMGTQSWGDAFAAFLGAPDVDRDALIVHLGLDAATLQDMLDSSPRTEIHCWLSAWNEMGILRGVFDAAYPAMEILVAVAEAYVAAMPEFDPELARELGRLN